MAEKVPTKLDDVVITISDLGDAEDFEKSTYAREFIDWIAAHSNLTREQVRRIPFAELGTLRDKIKSAIEEVTVIPKANSTPS